MNITREKGQRTVQQYRIPLIALTCLFFMWGFLRSMTDVIIPYFRKLFHLNYAESMLVQFSFLGAYFLGSLTYFLISRYHGDPIKKVGYKKALLTGITFSVIGCALFYPASALRVYGLFLLALLILGIGFTTLEIAANAYVTLLGNAETASARLNQTQAFNSLGTTLGPLIGGYFIFTLFVGGNGQPDASSIQYPYLIFTGVFILIGIGLYFIKMPGLQNILPNAEKEKQTLNETKSALGFPQLRLGIAGIFFYNGAETAIGSFIIVLLEHNFGFSDALAKNYLALYWGGSMAGRFIAPFAFNKAMPAIRRILIMSGIAVIVFLFLTCISHIGFEHTAFFLIFMLINITGFLIGRKSAALTLFIFAIICAILIAISVNTESFLMIYALLAIGLFNSIMFSNIYTLSLTGLGKHTSQGSSLLIMAVLGGGAMSLIQGLLADRFGLHISFVLHILSYSYVAFFGYYCYYRLKLRG